MLKNTFSSEHFISAVKLENNQDDPLVLLPEVVVQDTVDDGIEAAVEVCHEVAGCEQPLRNGPAQPGVQRYYQANQVQRRPADSKKHEHHKHGEKVAKVVRLDFGPRVRLDPPPDLDHQNPDSQVAIGDDAHRQNEVHHHHGDGVQRANRLRKGAGVHPRVVLQRLHKPVGHDGQDCERPDEHNIAHSVAAGKKFVVLEVVADVAVSVDCNASYVKDGADDTEPHEEAADLAVDVTCNPSIVKDGRQDQWIRIDGDYQVSKGQANHKGISYKNRRGKDTRLKEFYKKMYRSLRSLKEGLGDESLISIGS